MKKKINNKIRGVKIKKKEEGKEDEDEEEEAAEEKNVQNDFKKIYDNNCTRRKINCCKQVIARTSQKCSPPPRSPSPFSLSSKVDSIKK